MCGRFEVDAGNKAIERLLAGLPPDSPPVKLGEVFPSDNALALVGGAGKPRARALAWGFPKYDGKGLIINARAETALRKPMFRSALMEHPLALPVTGFYEWRGKEKFIFHYPGRGYFYLAGFGKAFEGIWHFVILTTMASVSMLPYHHRMPVMLGEENLDGWLSGRQRDAVIGQLPLEVAAEAVCTQQLL